MSCYRRLSLINDFAHNKERRCVSLSIVLPNHRTKIEQEPRASISQLSFRYHSEAMFLVPTQKSCDQKQYQSRYDTRTDNPMIAFLLPSGVDAQSREYRATHKRPPIFPESV